MKKVLVCLDGSPRERGVLDAAIALTRSFGATLTLFRSVGIPSELPREAYSMTMEDIPKLLQDRATRALEVLAETVPAELRAGIRVAIGTPWQSIERAASEVDADVIVIGAHGYQGLDRVLGTTAAKVVNHADRTVVVVRSPERLGPQP